MGRNKIEIKKIDCATKRRMTFGKRSRGLFKKAKELAVLCDVDVALVIFSPSGKPQHFSNRPRIEQLLQRFSKNIQDGNEAGMCSDVDKEECNGGYCESQLLESDNPPLPSQQIDMHVQVPIQHMQEGNEAGMSSDDKAKLARLESYLLESDDEDPSSSSNVHGHTWMQQLQVVEVPQGREPMQMPGVALVEMEEPYSIQTSVPAQFRSSEVRGQDGALDYVWSPPVGGVQPSLFFWDLPGGEAGSYNDLVLSTLTRWSPDRGLYE